MQIVYEQVNPPCLLFFRVLSCVSLFGIILVTHEQ